jgi:ribosome-associated protein
MDETKELVQRVVEGIQEKKGKHITVVDLTQLDAACRYFVLCEGSSNTHILAITDSVSDYVRTTTGSKPFATDGQRNALWVAMDYGDVMVHIFERETREFYNLEHLWSDAKLTAITDME